VATAGSAVPLSKEPKELILGCFDKPKILKGVRVYEFETRGRRFESYQELHYFRC